MTALVGAILCFFLSLEIAINTSFSVFYSYKINVVIKFCNSIFTVDGACASSYSILAFCSLILIIIVPDSEVCFLHFHIINHIFY
jgi:hypothetical protein